MNLIYKPQPLPKTGQTVSYADYDDGYYEKGFDRGNRFILRADLDDVIIIDMATGLMWPHDWVLNDFDVERNWAESVAFCAGLTLNGFTDWRIPNFLELLSLLHFAGAANPYIYDCFEHVSESKYYYTGTTVGTNTANARVVAFYSQGFSISAKTGDRLVVPCRSIV